MDREPRAGSWGREALKQECSKNTFVKEPQKLFPSCIVKEFDCLTETIFSEKFKLNGFNDRWWDYSDTVTILNSAQDFGTCPARTIDFTLPEKEVATWLFTNIMQPRKHRQPQLYLYGPPACGKTSFYIVLLKFLRIFKIVYETDFLELYGDDYYDLMIFDEFKGQKKITFLNSLIDGTPKIYNVKFATVPKNKNLPAIFLSNLSPFEVYKGKAGDISLDAFVDRLQIVQVDTLYNLCNFFNSFLPTGPPPVELPVPVHLVEDPGLPDLPSTPTSPTVNL